MTNELITKCVEDSRTEISHLVFAKDINGNGRLFGGQLLSWIDEVAGLVAKRHAMTNVTTASIDNLQFIEPCYLDDIVVLIGYITHVGHSSMEVRIDTYVEKKDGMRHPVNRAYFSMVALDEKDHPVAVPRLEINSVKEQANWDAAEKRIQLRKKRRTEGF
jgi:acyl-CoA hydrolase